MEVKAEATNGTPAPKVEQQNTNQTPQNSKGKFTNNGPNQLKKKNFQNRGGKIGGNMQGNNNRGPMKPEVSDEIREILISVLQRHFLLTPKQKLECFH